MLPFVILFIVDVSYVILICLFIILVNISVNMLFLHLNSEWGIALEMHIDKPRWCTGAGEWEVKQFFDRVSVSV